MRTPRAALVVSIAISIAACNKDESASPASFKPVGDTGSKYVPDFEEYGKGAHAFATVGYAHVVVLDPVQDVGLKKPKRKKGHVPACKSGEAPDSVDQTQPTAKPRGASTRSQRRRRLHRRRLREELPRTRLPTRQRKSRIALPRMTSRRRNAQPRSQSAER